MRAFVDNAEDIAAQLNGPALAVHHENAAGDPRTRGGTTLPGAAVALWRAKKKMVGGERICEIDIPDVKDSADGISLTVHFDIFGVRRT
jgi:hypothetical protein